jgi:hypothetical protein
MDERELLDAERAAPPDVIDARVWRMANLFVATHRFRENLRPVHHDLLAHARERLHHVNGRLRVEPDPRRTERVTITARVEGGA